MLFAHAFDSCGRVLHAWLRVELPHVVSLHDDLPELKSTTLYCVLCYVRLAKEGKRFQGSRFGLNLSYCSLRLWLSGGNGACILFNINITSEMLCYRVIRDNWRNY